MNKLVLSALAVVAALGFAAPANATTYVGVDVRIEAPNQTVDDRTVYISDAGCVITDTEGAEHLIDGTKAICALQEAANQGGYEFAVQNSDWGLYLTTIGDYAGDWTQYWLYYVDFVSASVGITEQELTDGQELLFMFGDGSQAPLGITAHTYHRAVGRQVRIQVGEYNTDYSTGEATYSSAAGMTVYAGETLLTTDAFGRAVYTPQTAGRHDVYVVGSDGTMSEKLAIQVYERKEKLKHMGRTKRKKLVKEQVRYLKEEYKAGNITDMATKQWVAMALASAKKKDKALFAEVRNFTPVTASEYARHIMTLEALGKNARKYKGTNYVAGLKNTMVNDQFGDEASCVDDIFAGLALLAADEHASSQELRAAVEYSLNCVNEDGAVSYAVGGPEDMDTTAAWLNLASRLKSKKKTAQLGVNLSDTRKLVTQHVRRTQKPDGGWGYNAEATSNSSTTAWMLMALRSRGHEARAMTTNNTNGFTYLRMLTDNGAVAYNQYGSQSVEVLNTAYSVLALKKKAFPVNKKARVK